MRRAGCSGTLVLALLPLLASGAGCSKDAKPTSASGAPEKTVAPPPVVTKKPSKPRFRKPDDSSAALLRYLPRDSSAVVGVNWRKARKSEVVRSYDERIARAAPVFAETKAKCGIDPLRDVHSAALGLGDDPSNDESMVFAVSGNFSREGVEACVRAQGGKVEGNRYDDTFNVHWPASNVIVLSKGQSSEQLSLSPSASAWDNDKLMVLVDEIDLAAGFWIAGMVPATLAATLSSTGAAPWGAYGSMDIQTGLSMTVGFEYSEASEAQSAMTMFSMGLNMAKGQPPLATLLDSVTLGVVGTALVVVGDFSADQVSQMQTMLKQAGL